MSLGTVQTAISGSSELLDYLRECDYDVHLAEQEMLQLATALEEVQKLPADECDLELLKTAPRLAENLRQAASVVSDFNISAETRMQYVNALLDDLMQFTIAGLSIVR